MVADRYVLQGSRISIAFQCVFLMVIAIVLTVLIHPLIVVLCLLFCLAIRFIFKPKHVETFEHLDQEFWSIKFKDNPQVKRVSLLKMIDHYFYIVAYFDEKNPSQIVIWKDQVDPIQWKRLITRAKLG